MLVNIEAERVRKKLSKEQLAKKLGISSRTYYNWITEENDIPSSALIKMSIFFNKSIDYLIDTSTDKD